MGIELQSTPQGHHRVVGSHGQTSKLGDASLTDETLGFAALMSLVSGQTPEGGTDPESTGLVLIPAGLDSASALSDVNATLVTGQVTGSAVFALPSASQTWGAGTTQAGDGDVPNATGQGVRALNSLKTKTQVQPEAAGVRQHGDDLAASVSDVLSEPLLQSSFAQLRPSLGQPVDVSNTPVVFDQFSPSVNQLAGASAVTAPVSTQPAAVVAMIDAPFAGNEIGGEVMAAAKNSVSGAVASQDQLIQRTQSRSDWKNASNLTVSSLPVVPLDTKSPMSTSIHSDQAPLVSPQSVVDLSNAEFATKTVLYTTASTAKVSSQTPLQTFVSNLDDEQVPFPVLKTGGVWSSQQITLAGLARHDANEMASGFSGTAALGSVALPRPVLALAPQDAGARVSERSTKHLLNRFGSGGEGVYGQSLTNANPADAVFQVTPTTGMEASTVVAEAVSFWVSQGVHSASLQLDGLGDEPVEVRISVSGEMTQVDFRTNQPEVRQAIEGAASQLKDLLASQGMQLAGLSIGTSGRGGSQDKGPRQTLENRKVTVLKSEVVETPLLRGANPSVGQSLDLFV